MKNQCFVLGLVESIPCSMQYNPTKDLQRGASHFCKTEDEKTQYNAKSKHNKWYILVIYRKRVKITLTQLYLCHKMLIIHWRNPKITKMSWRTMPYYSTKGIEMPRQNPKYKNILFQYSNISSISKSCVYNEGELSFIDEEMLKTLKPKPSTRENHGCSIHVQSKWYRA